MPFDYVLLTRHARSVYNERHVLNGDPTVDVPLSAAGVEQCRVLAEELAHVPVTYAVRSRFPRALQTLTLILGGRDVPVEVIPQFDDVALGVFEGRPVEEFRAWRREHGPDAVPPGGGESRVQCLRRYAEGYEALLQIDSPVVLGVVHDVTLRMMVNAINTHDPITGPVEHIPNATLYRFTADQIRRGLEHMRGRIDAAGPEVFPAAVL